MGGNPSLDSIERQRFEKMGPDWGTRDFLHQLLAGIAAVYMVCTILRLARFNVENSPDPASHKRFRGLPSPA